MRKTVAIIILILLGIAYFYYVGDKTGQSFQAETEFEKIMKYDLEQDYPSSPGQVMSINNQIIKYLYGQTIKEEEIEPVILFQRRLFHPDLLKLNPLEIQLEKVETEIQGYAQSDLKIIDTKMLAPEYLEDRTDAVSTKVLQYTNASDNIYVEYILAKYEGEWKILGWHSVDKFTIPEE